MDFNVAYICDREQGEMQEIIHQKTLLLHLGLWKLLILKRLKLSGFQRQKVKKQDRAKRAGRNYYGRGEK